MINDPAIHDSPTPMAGSEADQPCFQFKGGLVPLTQMELIRYDYQNLNQRLSRMVKQAPSFFRDMPVIINLERMSSPEDEVDFIELTEVCQAYGIYPVAVRGGSESQITAALIAGLPQIPSNPTHKAFHKQIDSTEKPFQKVSNAPAKHESDLKTRSSQKPETEHKEKKSSNVSEYMPTKIIQHAVRSGQQVYAPGGDLVILNTVSAGAEILADGNIHVYGTLRGRALAGIKGNSNARIFCHRLEAELLSIAGHYKMDEDLQRAHWKKSVQASLDGKKLKIELL